MLNYLFHLMSWTNKDPKKFNNIAIFKVPMTRKFLLFYLKEHKKISGLAVYSNTLSLLVAELFTKI